MTAYQLSCGHWQSEPPLYEIGSILPCYRCNALRTTVIGFAAPLGPI